MSLSATVSLPFRGREVILPLIAPLALMHLIPGGRRTPCPRLPSAPPALRRAVPVRPEARPRGTEGGELSLQPFPLLRREDGSDL